MTTLDVRDIARLPAAGDNTAIATRRLDAGTRVDIDGIVATIDVTVLEGHRFAVAPIRAGEALRSWGLPFGYALRDIAPGSYVHNQRMLDALRLRGVDFPLPDAPNFRDTALEPYLLDEQRFTPSPPTPRADPREARTFQGYDRGPARGVGTRNDIVVLATSSRSSSWASALEERARPLAARWPGVDGVVAVSHTEGGAGTPNNLDLLLRTLAGFVVHPNVGAVLVVDYGDEAVTGAMLRAYMRERGYPLDDVPHRFVTLRGGFDADLDRGLALIEAWLPQVSAMTRAPAPLSALKLGLQCGGSDAFSGVSGNPLAAWAALEIIRHGGAANLAETDELIGAEEYVLANARDIDTARRFLASIERFKERVGWHGHTAEGNPSGGNLYRGLYNIAIKSLGAAMKRHPDARLDHVIEYGEPMREPGYYFMDSPGNDLESIAGQVASGSNFLLFITGNGSITNFPFVPTIKIVTTTERYRLLEAEMDVNAGAYLDGASMDDLGAALVDRIVAAASGERTAGERAGHAQVSIWRDWPQSGPVDVAAIAGAPEPDGVPLATAVSLAAREMSALERDLSAAQYDAVLTPSGPAADQIGLVLPTSLCSGEVARQYAAALNERYAGRDGLPLSRFIALPHTEGCGVSSGSSEEIFVRVLVGHLLHPLTGAAVLLEHGCEKTHNDYLRHELRSRGVDLDRFGWASIQMDGGIDAARQRVEAWFYSAIDALGPRATLAAPLGCLRVGVAAVGAVTSEARDALATVSRSVVGAGGTVVLPHGVFDPFAGEQWRTILSADAPTPTLAFAKAPEGAGLHVMDTPSDHWVETLTGLAATGVEVVLACVEPRPAQAHRMVPLAQIAVAGSETARYRDDLDLLLDGDGADWPRLVMDLLRRVASREATPRLYTGGNVAFQITRGRLGVSM